MQRRARVEGEWEKPVVVAMPKRSRRQSMRSLDHLPLRKTHSISHGPFRASGFVPLIFYLETFFLLRSLSLSHSLL